MALNVTVAEYRKLTKRLKQERKDDAEEERKAKRVFTNTRNQIKGEAGETLAANTLSDLGLRMGEKINVDKSVVNDPSAKNGYRVVYRKKVSGDYIAVDPDTGRKVLIECKATDGRVLRVSHFRPQQLPALQETHECKGVSLIAWIRHGQVMFLDYPKLLTLGFRSQRTKTTKKGISLEMAEQAKINHISEYGKGL